MTAPSYGTLPKSAPQGTLQSWGQCWEICCFFSTCHQRRPGVAPSSVLMPPVGFSPKWKVSENAQAFLIAGWPSAIVARDELYIAAFSHHPMGLTNRHKIHYLHGELISSCNARQRHCGVISMDDAALGNQWKLATKSCDRSLEQGQRKGTWINCTAPQWDVRVTRRGITWTLNVLEYCIWDVGGSGGCLGREKREKSKLHMQAP